MRDDQLIDMLAIQVQIGVCLIEAMGMLSENQDRARQGLAPAYPSERYLELCQGIISKFEEFRAMVKGGHYA